MKIDRFIITICEFLIIRPLLRSTGDYRVTVVEYDAKMTAPFCYTYGSTDLCKPYDYKFNRYVDAQNFMNGILENHIVPYHQATFTYNHSKLGLKKVLEMKW